MYMKSIALAGILLFLTIGCFAQGQVWTRAFPIDTSGYVAMNMVPLGNSLNDNMVVFYEMYNNQNRNYTLKWCIVSPNGATNVYNALRPFVGVDAWDATFHIASNKYCLAHAINNSIGITYISPINGNVTLFTKYINTTVVPKRLFIARTRNGKFSIIYTGANGSIWNLVINQQRVVLTHNDITSTFGSDPRLIDFTEGKNGEMSFYYLKKIGTNMVQPFMKRYKHNMVLLGEYPFSGQSYADSTFFYLDRSTGAYSAKQRRHMLIYYNTDKSSWMRSSIRYNGRGKKTYSYASLSNRGKLIYNSKKRLFYFVYPQPVVSGGNESTRFIYSAYNPKGVSKGVVFWSTIGYEDDGFATGFSKLGSTLLVWNYDGGPLGLHGRLGR